MSKIFHQTLCTVPRLNMNALMFDRMDMVIYNSKDSALINMPDEFESIKNSVVNSEYIQDLNYTDRQIQSFINAWNTADKRPLAPYQDTWIGNIISDALAAVCPELKPLRCPDSPSSLIFELTPEACATLIEYLTKFNEENDIRQQISDFTESVATDLFDIEEVVGNSSEISMIPDMITKLKRVLRSDFNTMMSYFYIS